MKSTWILQALASTAIYAVAALLDRYVLFAKKIPSYHYFLCGSLVGLLIAIGALFKAEPEIALTLNSLLGIVAGMLFGIFTFLYFRTIAQASPVSTAAFMQAVPVISTFAAPIFFSQSVSATSASAILLLCCGLSFISLIDRDSIHKVVPRMLPAVVLLSIGYIIQKHLLDTDSNMAVFALNRVGNFFVSGALVIAYRVRSRNPKLPEPSSRIILVGAAIVGELLSVLGLYLSLLAYRTGPFPNVSAVLATLPVWVLIGALIMNRLRKAPVWALPESMSGASLVLTLISLAAIAVSVYLISLG